MYSVQNLPFPRLPYNYPGQIFQEEALFLPEEARVFFKGTKDNIDQWIQRKSCYNNEKYRQNQTDTFCFCRVHTMILFHVPLLS